MYLRSRVVIIDFEYLCGNNDQKIIKELAIMQPDSIFIETYHFLPPFPNNELNTAAKQSYTYKKESINSLEWDDGDIPYNNLSDILEPFSDLTVLVSSEEKKNFLKQYLENISIIENLPPFSDHYSYKHNCTIHEAKNFFFHL